jgi:hypothetical protein
MNRLRITIYEYLCMSRRTFPTEDLLVLLPSGLEVTASSVSPIEHVHQEVDGFETETTKKANHSLSYESIPRNYPHPLVDDAYRKPWRKTL